MIGLQVNLGKSEMVPMGEVEKVLELVNLLYCKVRSFLMTYLGMPLGALLNQQEFGIPFWRNFNVV